MKGINEIKAANKQVTVDAYWHARDAGNTVKAGAILEAYREDYDEIIVLPSVLLTFGGVTLILPAVQSRAEREAQIGQCVWFYGPVADSYLAGKAREDDLTQADGSDND